MFLIIDLFSRLCTISLQWLLTSEHGERHPEKFPSEKVKMFRFIQKFDTILFLTIESPNNLSLTFPSRTGPLSAPLIDYNRKTKHFTPLGLTDLVEKGKPKSNRLDNFLDPRKAPEELKNVDDFVYFSGERELMDSFGEDYFIKAFSNQFKFKTIWTNKSLTGFEVPPQILVTPLTTHSVVSSPKVRCIGNIAQYVPYFF